MAFLLMVLFLFWAFLVSNIPQNLVVYCLVSFKSQAVCKHVASQRLCF